MILRPFLTFCLFLFAALSVRAEAVRNGNELALTYSRAEPRAKPELSKQSVNKLYTFRFLKVVSIDPPAVPGALPVYHTIEPSSDLAVEVHPQGPVSKTVCATVGSNDCIVVNGRLLKMGDPANTLIVDPAVVRSKDRAAPKGEKELLPEIDPTAVK